MSPKRPRRYVTAGSRPTELPHRQVVLVCPCCGHTSSISLTLDHMTSLPAHCNQPMLIGASPQPAGARKPSPLP